MQIPPFVSLCNMASGHMSEHTLFARDFDKVHVAMIGRLYYRSHCWADNGADCLSCLHHCQKSWTFRVRDKLSAASLFKMADKNNRSQAKRFPYDILNNLSSLDLFYEVYIP